MATRNVVLSPELDACVDEAVASGEYSNASEVMRAALRDWHERRKEQREWLAYVRREAEEGFAEFDRGEGVVVNDVKVFMADIRGRAESRRQKRNGA